MTKRLLGLLAATLVFSFTSIAQADDDEEARAAMRRGIAAFGRGDTEAALVEYESAKKLAPAANAPFLYAAEALVKLGRWKEAAENFETYLTKNPNVSDAEHVRVRIAKIRAEHFPGRVKLVANAESVTIWIDGKERGALETPRSAPPPSSIGTFELEPGPHKIEARSPARVSATQEVNVVGDTEVSLSFALADAPAPLPPPVEPKPASSTWRTVGIIGAGTGAAVLVASIIVDAAALGPKIEDYRSAADRGDVSARELRDDVDRLQSVVLVGYVAGGLLTAGGVALSFLAPSSSSRVSVARNGLVLRF